MSISVTGRSKMTFTSNVQVYLHLSAFFGRENRNFFLSGTRTFEFDPITGSDKANLSLADFELTSAATTISIGSPRGFRKRNVPVPEITFTPSMIDVSTVRGRVNLKTGAFSIEYALVFSSSVLDAFGEFGINERVPITIVETGTLDIVAGGAIQSRFSLKVGPNYKGPFEVGCTGVDCETEVFIFATLNQGEGADIPPTKVIFVCPGETVGLHWHGSDDVHEVTIEPDIGTVAASGFIEVTPRESTFFTIAAEGKCKRRDFVGVVVVDKPTTFRMTAFNAFNSFSWHFEAVAGQFSRNLRVTRIQPRGGAGCFAHEPTLPYVNYLFCGSDPEQCNVRWAGRHTGEDGGPPDDFNLDETHATCGSTINNDAEEIPSIPILGIWEFKPLDGEAEKPPQGSAFFLLELACR